MGKGRCFEDGVYLDNAATSYPKPDAVMEDMVRYMRDIGATSSRGAYKKAIESDKLIYEARKGLARLFHCPGAANVVFTLNVTEALNLALQGLLDEGDHVITSSLEHNAVWRCLKTLERDRGIIISKVKADVKGYTNALDVEKELRENTKLIVFNHASNVVGTIQPVREIGLIAERHEIPFLVDAAQTAGAYPIDMEEDHISLLAFTGHKSLLGPTGTGGLAIRWNGGIRPLKQGGTGGDSAYEYQPDYLPNKFEAGTMSVAGIVGLRASVRYLLECSVEKIRAQEEAVTAYALHRLEEVKGLVVYGPKKPADIVGTISFNIGESRPEEVGVWLDREWNISVRSGLHCAPSIHSIIGTKGRGTVRIGIGYCTTCEEIDYLIDALKRFVEEKGCI